MPTNQIPELQISVVRTRDGVRKAQYYPSVHPFDYPPLTKFERHLIELRTLQ